MTRSIPRGAGPRAPYPTGRRDVDIDGATILVTGANGFVGGRVARRLLEDGAIVRAMVRTAGATSDIAAPAGRGELVEVIGDFTAASDVADAVVGADAVVHCAATAGPDLDAVREVNTAGTRTVVEAAREAGVTRLVHISTGSVYDRSPDVGDVDEDTPRVTEGDPYSLTKAEAEAEVEAGMEAGLTATILRPPAVLGWGPTSTWGQRFPAMVRAGELPFTPNPDTTHVWVHVDDLADAVATSLRDDRAIGRTYDVIGGCGTWREYLEAVMTFVDAARDPFAGDPPPPWTGRIRGQRLRDELDWSPSHTFEDAMQEAARDFRG